jgi:hypothetical protein
METPPPATAPSTEVARYLRRLETDLARIDRELFQAWWGQFAGTVPEGNEPWQILRNRLVGRPELLAFVRGAATRPHPPFLARRLELLRRIAEDARVEQHPSVVRLRARLSRRVMAFRPRWEGRPRTPAQLREVLRRDPHEARRHSAYLALRRLDAEVEGELRQLVLLRNAKARELGYRSFADFRLATEGLDRPRLLGFIDDVAAVSRTAIRKIGEEFRREHGSFLPWDDGFALEQRTSLPDRLFPGRTMVPDTLAALRAWGFRGHRRPFRILKRPIPIGGMTLAVELPNDVRVVVNPRGSWVNYMILLHEFGHAVQDTYTRGRSHLLRGPENIPGFAGFHEGIGATFEEISVDPGWLGSRPGFAAADVEGTVRSLREDRLWGAGLNAQWVRSELELYDRPESDLSRAFYRRRRATLGFDVHSPDSFADPFWIDAAFYGKSYLIATLVAAQLLSAVHAEVPGPTWPNRGVVPWLADRWFRHGMLYDWVPRMRDVTGRPFGSRAFRDAVSAAG